MPKNFSKLKQVEQFLMQICSIELQTFSCKKSFWMLVGFYFIYLSKSAFGINISDKYTAPKFLKAPLTTIDCVFPLEGYRCYKSPKKV